MKNDNLTPDDYRWVKVKTGEEILMTGRELEAALKDKTDRSILNDPEDAERKGQPSGKAHLWK